MTTPLILYGTEHCHLCHEAQSQLRQLGLSWLDIDIADREDLLQHYGTRIPVLVRQDSGTELSWPFQPQDVLRLLLQSP